MRRRLAIITAYIDYYVIGISSPEELKDTLKKYGNYCNITSSNSQKEKKQWYVLNVKVKM